MSPLYGKLVAAPPSRVWVQLVTFFDTNCRGTSGIKIALAISIHQIMAGLVESKIRSRGGYLINDWRLWAKPFQGISSDDRPDTGAYLVLISLLSLGLWAAIWGVVASLFSATL